MSGPLYASDTYLGSTEEKLQCHSGEVKDFLHRWVRAGGDGDISQCPAVAEAADLTIAINEELKGQ
jgi:hypothetical protein|tara:strand:- start:670 stop:867 length:198 start_codon:yes stop_codon:yes gene_type:complete